MANISAVTASNLATMSRQQDYLHQLRQRVTVAVPPELSLPDLRARAEAILHEQAFPSTRDEDWRFTDLSALLDMTFTVAESAPVATPDLAPVGLAETAGARVVVVNGRFEAALSKLDGLPQDAVVGSLSHLLVQGKLNAKLGERLAQSQGSQEVFTALNTAGFLDAVVIWLPPHLVVETPIQIVYLSQPQVAPALAQPRCLVMAESGSALTLVEDYWGVSPQPHLTNAVTELWVETSAQVTHSRVQREGAGTYHIGKTVVSQGRDSAYVGTAVSLGSALSRHNWEMYQTGPQTTTKLYGLGAISHTQHADTHSLAALSHPHGSIEQLHKCIVDGKAHSVFNGRIAVSQAAQLTAASQLNRNLLLSDRARVDTKPQLEIVADNVKCAHGATVSQLQADEIFYLQSRGISAPQAQRLLIHAFAMEVLNTISVPSLRLALTQAMTQRT
ncbi:MAG: Fe-S cluster assembly protein SufD [Nodosilinea sp.]